MLTGAYSLRSIVGSFGAKRRTRRRSEVNTLVNTFPAAFKRCVCRSGKDKEWVSGTTWVFDSDGSGGSLVFGGKEKFTLKVQSVQDEATVVIASSAVSSAGSASVQDFIDDFETDVGLVSSSPLKQPSTVPASPTILREHEDLR